MALGVTFGWGGGVEGGYLPSIEIAREGERKRYYLSSKEIAREGERPR